MFNPNIHANVEKSQLIVNDQFNTNDKCYFMDYQDPRPHK